MILKRHPVTIIVPVYGDWDSLKENIEALLEEVPENSKNKVMYVNDCGPEADLLERNILDKITGRENLFYYRNKKNLGFVKNCNNAVLNISDKDSDILLLNSDAVVTKGFLREMQAILYKRKVGAVSPRSNAATIFSIPMSPVRQYTMEESYSIYKKIRNKLPKYYFSPIAHGFCILIRREVINSYGLFDEIYDKGYGEENDFCMRIQRHGWKCAVANKAFVFHYKARSFSEEKRKKLIAKNEKILDKRYPEYRGAVRNYAENIVDPIEHTFS